MTAKRDQATTFVERRTPPASIEQVPGFAIFKDWLGAEFGGIRREVGELRTSVSGLSEKVDALSACVNEGNGMPSLKEQVHLNTRFREDAVSNAKDACRARRTALLAFIGSIVVLLANVILRVAGIL